MSILIAIIPFFIFMGFILFMLRLSVKYSGGWTDLEGKYKTKKKPKEIGSKNLKIRSCNFGGISVQNMFTFYETNEGLLIAQAWLTRHNEFNILIPWQEIVEYRERKLLFGKMYRLVIGDPFISFIDLRGKDFEKIRNKIILR